MKSTIAIFIIFSLSLSTFANTCGGNCPSNDCPSCPCGTSSNHQSIQEWCSQYSGWDQECCQCIVNHESGGNGNAANYNENGSFDVGFWQINDQNWNSCSGGKAPCDLNTNLACAIKVWQWGGNSFKLWSTAEGCGCTGKESKSSKSKGGNSNGGKSKGGKGGNGGNSGNSGNSGEESQGASDEYFVGHSDPSFALEFMDFDA